MIKSNKERNNVSNDLLYVREHLSCKHYVSDYKCRFRIFTYKAGERVTFEGESLNFMDFYIAGEAKVSCNRFKNREIGKGRMIFIPKGALCILEPITEVKVMRCAFDTVNNVCDKLNLHSYWPLCANMEPDFRSLPIKPQLELFIESLDYYLEQGVNCEHYHELKQQELFLILRWFYYKEELAQLFYPIIGKSIDFKALVLENYLKVSSVAELAELSHMGRSNFDTRFKEEFGIPAGQWMLKQTAMHVKHHLSAPGVTVSDVMHRFNFNSPTHFTRFCKQQFGYTPTELISKLQKV